MREYNPESQAVNFSDTRIVPREPQSKQGKELIKNGARLLTVDITPSELQSVQEFKERPLSISVVEILPRKANIVSESDNSGGFLFNAGTHDEATSLSVAIDIINTVSHIPNRNKPVIITSGLVASVERLEKYLGVKIEDINREFIGLHTIPQNPFQNLTQNFLKFIFTRYSQNNLDFIDLHTDPVESYINPYFIQDRQMLYQGEHANNTAKEDAEAQLYTWLMETFSNISVVMDERPEAYFKDRLHQSLPAALLYCGFEHTATLECSAGKNVDSDMREQILIQLLLAMLKTNIFPPTNELTNTKLSERSHLSEPINSLFRLGNTPLRRGSISFQVGQSGVINIPKGNLNKIWHKSDTVGIIETDTGPQKLIIPRDSKIQGIDDGFTILGIPYRGIGDSVEISVAIPDFRKRNRFLHHKKAI